VCVRVRPGEHNNILVPMFRCKHAWVSNSCRTASACIIVTS